MTIACLTLALLPRAGNGAVFKLVPTEFPDDAGAAAGIVGAAGGLGGFFPPLLMGVVKDQTGSYTLGLRRPADLHRRVARLAVWLLRTAPGRSRCEATRPHRDAHA